MDATPSQTATRSGGSTGARSQWHALRLEAGATPEQHHEPRHIYRRQSVTGSHAPLALATTVTTVEPGTLRGEEERGPGELLLLSGLASPRGDEEP